MYPIRYTDAGGETLTGAHRYRLIMPTPPPVDAFWSLTIYNAADKMLVDNPRHRYKISPDTEGLRTGPDGSLTIDVQHEEPEPSSTANWLPAPPGDFYLILRLYQPGEAILDGTYPLPQVERCS